MFKDQTGHLVPNITFRIYKDLKWINKTTDDFFKDKRVVVFALPGAFTPVCSSLHLPSFNDLYDTIRSNGIDDVYCLAMNDSFVLEAWKKAEKAFKITMLPDTDGEFTKRLGFLSHNPQLCLGDRSWRYAMIVNDKVIEKMFIEPQGTEVDPYGASSAENVLKYLNPGASLPDQVTVFTKHSCPECQRAKDLLDERKIPYEELVLNEHFSIKTVKAIAGSTYLPQVFVNGKNIGLHELKDRYRNLKLAS